MARALTVSMKLERVVEQKNFVVELHPGACVGEGEMSDTKLISPSGSISLPDWLFKLCKYLGLQCTNEMIGWQVYSGPRML